MKKVFLSSCIFLILLPFSLFSSELKRLYKNGRYVNPTGNTIPVSFESFDMPGWYIGAEDRDALLFSINMPIEKEFTTFNIVPGTADRKAVSIEAATDRNFYLSGQEKFVTLDEYSHWEMFRQNTTFIIEPGLADKNNKNLVSIRSWKYPKMYLRHLNRKLVISDFDGSNTFKWNATFVLKSPNWNGKNKLSTGRKGNKSFSCSRNASLAAFLFSFSLVIITLVIVFINQSKKNRISKLQPKTG